MINLYFVLGVAPQCSMAELKSAYRRCARETHPDHRGDAQRFQRIQEAYDILGDPQKRALYDQALYAWMQKLCDVQGPSRDAGQGSLRPPQEAQRREVFVAEVLREPWPIERLQRQHDRLCRQKRLQELEASRWGQRVQQASTGASRQAAEQRRAVAAARLADLVSEANRMEAEMQRLRHELRRSAPRKPQPVASPSTAAPSAAASSTVAPSTAAPSTTAPSTAVPSTAVPSTAAPAASATASRDSNPSAPASLRSMGSAPRTRGRRGRGRSPKTAFSPAPSPAGPSSEAQHAAMLGAVQELLPRLAAEIIAQMTKDGAAQ